MTNQKTWIKGVYDRTASGYGEKGCSFFAAFGERLVDLAHLSSGDHILDVATGKGAVLFPAAQQVGPTGRAIGIDFSSRMLEEAAKTAPCSWIELREMDAEHLLFPDHSFDAVLCGFALFFFPHLMQALSEFKRVLRAHGRLAVSTWGKKCALDQWVSDRLTELGIPSKLKATSLDNPAALEQTLADAGFQQIEIREEVHQSCHEDAAAWWDSLWTHGIRSRLEQLSSSDLDNLKREALSHAGSGQVNEERQVFYALAQAF